MIGRSWAECVALYGADEKTWRMSAEERARDWANGRCGQCTNTMDDHQPPPEVTAGAVLATPYLPVDPLVAAYIRGEVVRTLMDADDWELLHTLLHLIPDDHTTATGGVR